jgi:hypothetical protein
MKLRKEKVNSLNSNHERIIEICSDNLSSTDLSITVALEAERLANKYGKDTFDCEDLQTILGVGRNNIRELMRSKNFPTLSIGGRRVVSAIALANWFLRDKS